MTSSTLKQAVAGLVFIALAVLSWAGQGPPAASPFVGEYFVTENKDDICVPYTRNLNQFRRLDFNVCDPRLSAKYPEFTRPAWEEIPLDLALAEQIIKNTYSRPENAVYWEEWLKVSEPLRAEGKIKLWQTHIDIDGDGKPETMLWLQYPLTPKEEREGKGWRVDPSACIYRNSKLYMLESPNASMRKGFKETAYSITDILHFSGGLVRPCSHNAYYGLEQRVTLPSTDGQRIGATRGLKVARCSTWALANAAASTGCPPATIDRSNECRAKRIALERQPERRPSCP